MKRKGLALQIGSAPAASPSKRTGEKALRVFFSYAAADRAEANRVRALLSRLPRLELFTPENLSAGEPWESKLKDELSRCDMFVVLLSRNSVSSTWVLHELGAAWGLNKPILPIVTDPDLLSEIPLNMRGYVFTLLEDLKQPGHARLIFERYANLATSHGTGLQKSRVAPSSRSEVVASRK
jgi:hypothetical protein